MAEKASDPRERLQELREQIEHHNRLYYIEAQPEIQDYEYDKLYRELVELESKHPELVTPDSPSLRVGGAPLASFEHVTHQIPMMSLDNTYSIGELNDFDKQVRKLSGNHPYSYILEPKVDGVAFTLRYENGVLSVAGTRGDGQRGDDITANVRTIKSIPLRIDTKAAVVEVRGEVYMSKAGFQRFTEQQIAEGKDPFRNPRNATAGSLKLLDSRVVAQRPLYAVLYGFGLLDGISFQTHAEFLEQLKKWGFPTVERYWKCADIGEVLDAIATLEKLRHDFPYEIDGAVVKVNELELYSVLGSTAKSPRWAKAYKYAPEQTETVVRDITVQVGRTGVLTPVAELEPVFLAGSEIRRATLHNADYIKNKDIRIGDHVLIEKAGEVIPAVISVVKDKRPPDTVPYRMPQFCPACGEPVVQKKDEAALLCENLQCPAQSERLLRHFASRNCLDIEALGDIVAEKLISSGMVKSPLDLFILQPIDLERLNLGDDKSPRFFGAKNAGKLLEAVERARDLPLDRWLFAFGIPRVGRTVARRIAEAHKDFEEVVNSELLHHIVEIEQLNNLAKKVNPKSTSNPPTSNADREKRTAEYIRIMNRLEELGKQLEKKKQTEKFLVEEKNDGTPFVTIQTIIKFDAAQSLVGFFESERGKATARQMRELGINPQSTQSRKGNKLSGKTFVLTGTLASMSRDEAGELIRSQGGTVTNSVTGKTDYLVAGANTGANKTNKARELGVEILDEQALLNMLGTSHSKAERQPKKQAPQQLSLF